jgi:hypothetical protein
LFRWMLDKVIQNASHFDKELVGHFPRETVANQNALDDEVFAVGRHGIGGDEPAALTQSIGEVVEGEA